MEQNDYVLAADALAASDPTIRRPWVPVLNFILGEPFLGFMAIVAGALVLIPLFFPLTAHTNALVELSQWLIVGLFALEYILGLARAASKKQFVSNPWRLIDAATVLIPVLTLLPGTSLLFRSSPVLRLMRLARVLSLGVRASGVLVREESRLITAQTHAPVQIHFLPASGTMHCQSATWEQFVHWAKKPGAEWYSIANVGPHNVRAVAQATNIPEDFIASHLLGTSYPHLDWMGAYLSLFVWLPTPSAQGRTERTGLLLLASHQSVVTFSRQPSSLLEKLSGPTHVDLTALPFPVRVLCQLMRGVLDANEKLVATLEEQLRNLEELPVRESRPQFFEQTFRLKKELSATQSDLWRLRGVLKELAEARVKLPGYDGGPIAYLHEVAEAADYLYETVSNIREGVLSLIELHLNVVSFEMNRVMRVLAVVSVLGLIPAVVGGLFGMNLKDNPWPFTLPQVTFAVALAMITSLYLFVVKGWLR